MVLGFRPKLLSCLVLLGILFSHSGAIERVFAQQTQTAPNPNTNAAPSGTAGGEAPKFTKDQLDSLVAPIALYPDPLLAQALAASTYPLELVQLQQWLSQNKNLKGKELVAAVEKQGWDASVQAMAPLPDVVKRMTENIKWTTDLGNAFLAQQSEVMDAVQRLRVKAKDKGALKSNDKMKVETKTENDKSVVVIEQADPQVVYVPTYNPTVVYGPAVYPYPYVYYPPPGYYAGGMFLSFSFGVAMGAAFSGGWGYHPGWGGSNVYVNNNNTFVQNSNRVAGNANRGAGNQWRHNPQHRGGAPYPNRATANQFGGDRSRGPAGGQQFGAGNRTSPNRIGNQNVSPRSTGGSSAFGGGSRGFSGSGAGLSSARGSSSMRGFGGGGGGGFRGGGGRR
jgi:hypothetical protein